MCWLAWVFFCADRAIGWLVALEFTFLIDAWIVRSLVKTYLVFIWPWLAAKSSEVQSTW